MKFVMGISSMDYLADSRQISLPPTEFGDSAYSTAIWLSDS